MTIHSSPEASFFKFSPFIWLVSFFLVTALGCDKPDLPADSGNKTRKDGAIYLGDFLDGQFHGQGTLTYSDGKKYVGSFSDGLENGEGSLQYPDGRKYEGSFVKGKMSGTGTLTYPDGKKYIGEFKGS